MFVALGFDFHHITFSATSTGICEIVSTLNSSEVRDLDRVAGGKGIAPEINVFTRPARMGEPERIPVYSIHVMFVGKFPGSFREIYSPCCCEGENRGG